MKVFFISGRPQYVDEDRDYEITFFEPNILGWARWEILDYTDDGPYRVIQSGRVRRPRGARCISLGGPSHREDMRRAETQRRQELLARLRGA